MPRFQLHIHHNVPARRRIFYGIVYDIDKNLLQSARVSCNGRNPDRLGIIQIHTIFACGIGQGKYSLRKLGDYIAGLHIKFEISTLQTREIQ